MLQRRGRVHDLVEGEQAEVDRHDLDDRQHPTECGADPRADERRFRQWRVAHTLGPELLEQAHGDGVAAAVFTDVLAHDEDPVILRKCGADPLAHRFPVRDRRHDNLPATVLDGL